MPHHHACANAWAPVRRAVACLLLLCCGCGKTLHVRTIVRPTETAVVLEPYPPNLPTDEQMTHHRLDLGLRGDYRRFDDPEPLPGWHLVIDRRSKHASYLQRPWNLPARLERQGDRLLYWSVTDGHQEERPRAKAGDLIIRHYVRIRGGVPVRYHLLRLAPDQLGRLRIRTAGDTIRSRRTVAEQAADDVAAINGGFFDMESGAPLGALKIDGEWIKPPLFDRTALLLPAEGPPVVAAVAWRGMVHSGAGAVPIDTLNRTPHADEACAVTTPRWGGPRSFAGFVAQPVTGTPYTVHTREPLPPPLRVELRSEPEAPNILGGGPRLVRDGHIDCTSKAERFRSDITDTISARTAFCLAADGGATLAYVECSPRQSAGISLEGWAALLRELGFRDAMGFDGATMATMAAEGKLIGRPQAGEAQAVATVLAVARP